MRYLLILCLICSGCTPLISNVVQLGSGQDKVTMSNKADADQSPQTPVNAAVPVSVGATPTSTGTVQK